MQKAVQPINPSEDAIPGYDLVLNESSFSLEIWKQTEKKTYFNSLDTQSTWKVL